ncbi:enoyl-CoA hydratase-related protein [Streptomyces mexicanus]|uniref:enoyl-CoA hydratase-related protein n=1 Tax=Streptomyces mexicanus TaxID=178566 RepID=UPI003AFF7D2B
MGAGGRHRDGPHCDLVVAARNASFGLPGVTRGIIAPAGGLVRLPRRILVAPSPRWISGT